MLATRFDLKKSPETTAEPQSLSSKKRAVSVLFDDDEYAVLVRVATELTLHEGRRVSVAELVRRATLTEYGARIDEQRETAPRA